MCKLNSLSDCGIAFHANQSISRSIIPTWRVHRTSFSYLRVGDKILFLFYYIRCCHYTSYSLVPFKLLLLVRVQNLKYRKLVRTCVINDYGIIEIFYS